MPSAALEVRRRRAHPWELSRAPGYNRARPVPEVRALALSPGEVEGWLRESRPLVIRGAVAHWPAVERWRDLAYVERLLGADTLLRPRSSPKVEAFGAGTRERERRARAEERRRRAVDPAMTGAELVASLASEDDRPLFHEVLGRRRAFAPLLPDLGALPFLSGAALRPTRYPPFGAMFYRSSYSDWHYHPRTEALMCQIVGAKEVLLYGPDDASEASVGRALRTSVPGYPLDGSDFPELAGAQPHRAVVGPGDGLLIPVYWWHAVQPVDHGFGATVPRWWGAAPRSWGDLRRGAARRYALSSLINHPASFPSLVPRLVAGTLLAALGPTLEVGGR